MTEQAVLSYAISQIRKDKGKNLIAKYYVIAKPYVNIFKDKDYCPIEIIKGLTDKGRFQYLTKLMGPQEGTYLYATQFHSLR